MNCGGRGSTGRALIIVVVVMIMERRKYTLR